MTILLTVAKPSIRLPRSGIEDNYASQLTSIFVPQV